VVLIRIERALLVISPAYNRGDTEEQVKERWRQYWRKLWEGVEQLLYDHPSLGDTAV
jgi:hypothetical protein